MIAVVFDGNNMVVQNIGVSRLEQIRSHDQEWYNQLKDFIEVFPEFSKFQEIAPLESGRKNAKKLNLLEPGKDFDEPVTIFENTLYYVACAGVRFSYGLKQWAKLREFINRGDWMQNCTDLWNFLNSSDIQPAKKDTYWGIFSWMNINNITKDTITIDNALTMKNVVKGLGVGYEGFMKEKFTDRDDFCEYSDIGYKGGIKKVYGPLTDTEIKKKSELFVEMGFGRVANRFMFQIFHYADRIGL